MVPDWVRSLTGLTCLGLPGNRLTAVPDWLGNLTALTELHLGGNHLTALPDSLGNLTALTKLDVGGNPLTALPETLGNLTALTRLDLSRNRLTAVPDWLGNLTALTELNLGDNQLTAIPGSIGSLTVLTRLDLSRNRLTALPDSLGNLTALTELHLGGNQLAAIPDSLGNLTALTELHLNGNQLTALPDSLGSLSVLTRLDLSRNRLTALPDSLGNLTALTELDLGGYPLTAVPDWLPGLTALTDLRLSGDQLAVALEWAARAPASAKVHLNGKPVPAFRRGPNVRPARDPGLAQPPVRERIRVIPLWDLEPFCWGNTLDHFYEVFPDGFPASLEAIKVCREKGKFSPLDPLCGLLDLDQRRRVATAQVRAYITSDELIQALRDHHFDIAADALLAQYVDEPEDVPGAIVLMEQVTSLPISKFVQDKLRLRCSDLKDFADPGWRGCVLWGNSFDEDTARWIVEELNSGPSGRAAGTGPMPKAALRQTVQAVLILSRASLAKTDADQLLWQILDQQRSTWGRVVAVNPATRVVTAGQSADDLQYAYVMLQESFPDLGLRDAFDRILKFDPWKASDGNSGTFYIVVDR